MRTRFNGLDLIHKLPEDFWSKVHDIIKGKSNTHILGKIVENTVDYNSLSVK